MRSKNEIEFIGLQHCKCGISWMKSMGYFGRTSTMVFGLQKMKIGKKMKQISVIKGINSNILFLYIVRFVILNLNKVLLSV